MKYMNVAMKDGNRIVNWELPKTTTIRKLIDMWEKDYFPCEEFTVSVNDSGRMTIVIKTKFPKKRKEEDDANVC